MNYNELIANSNTAFGGNQFDIAFDYAKKAVSMAPNQSEGYFCAGKACMSMDSVHDAVKYFSKAVELDKKNGNGFFLLGYSQILADEPVNALKSMTKALETNCDNSLKSQIYKMMCMINTDQGDYENALLNIKQAESYIGLDYELLQQKAGCYASLQNYHKTVFTLNQMKLLKPNDYMAYSLAFNVFMELNMYDEAKAELERAEEFAALNMSYYNDVISYTLLHDPDKDTAENIKPKWLETIKAIDNALKKGQPTAEQAFELYLRAAQMYVSLQSPDYALACLDASMNPVASFNNGFSVVFENDAADEMDIPTGLTPEEEEVLMEEKWENGEFDEIREGINEALMDTYSDDPEEISEAVEQYLSPIDNIPSSNSTDEEDYTISGEFTTDSMQKDIRNSLYISVYELTCDYSSMLQKARELQTSDNIANQYTGIYYELKVGKYTNAENWQRKYRDRINFWTKRMLEDPTDFVSASYRIRSYIDLENFDNAEQLCSCLPTDVKEALMEEINKAKAQGGGEDEHTS
ncbi:MAG: tetratricopeptide repeat protein [Ruminococcus sp.]|nr:tetratricopeptide repeat protein [Ruminococcus sp.]